MVTERPGPGRPRSEQSRQAILTAALDLAIETGYARSSVDAIAVRAGVGKQTIYRWWPTKADVLLEAGASEADVRVPVSDRGSYAADLTAFLRASQRMTKRPGLTELLRALMAEAQLDPDFADRFRSAFLQRRRDALAVILDRARERGDLPHRADPDTVADVVFGTIWYRILATGKRLDARWVTDLVRLLCDRSADSTRG